MIWHVRARIADARSTTVEQCRTLFTGAKYEFELCWAYAGTSSSTSLFGVSDYLASLALLLMIYTISDDRSKFRLMIAPAPVYNLIFWLFVCVFILKALVELWFYLGWPIFPFLDNRILLDAVLLTLSVGTIFIWVYLSYIRPPVFSRWNNQKFFLVYQRLIHKGTQEELRLALIKLSQSAKSIIKSASAPPQYVKAIGNRFEQRVRLTIYFLAIGVCVPKWREGRLIWQ